MLQANQGKAKGRGTGHKVRNIEARGAQVASASECVVEDRGKGEVCQSYRL